MNKPRPRIYISGPITKGCAVHNYGQAAVIFKQLLEMGFAPFNPMFSMTMPGADQIAWEDWIAIDLPWVEASDAVFRLPGESEGADVECDAARAKGIPVLSEIRHALEWLLKREGILSEATK